MAKAWQWAAAPGTTRTIQDPKGVSETWRGRSGRLAAEANVRLWSWLMKRSFISARGASSRLCPYWLHDTMPEFAFDLLQGILRLLKSLLDCEQRSLMGFFLSLGQILVDL